MLDDERTGVVAEHRARHAAEVTKRHRDPFAPVVLPLGEERFDEDPARVAQDGDEQVHAHERAADRYALLPEVDLHLRARRRLEAHACDRGGHALATP
jgi:hypothetical protein